MADEVEERKSSKSGNRSGPYQRRSRVGSHFYFRQVETGPRSLMLRNRAVSTLGTPPLHSPLSSASNCSSTRSEEHTSELQSHLNLVCRLLLEKKKKKVSQIQTKKKRNYQ